MSPTPSSWNATDFQTARRLVALLRALLAADDAALRDALRAVDDWTGLLATARAQRVLELLASRLRGADAGLPQDVAATLEQARRAAAGRAFAAAHDTAAVVADLAASGVAAAVFKGQALAVQAYGDPLARTSIDLDLLIAQRDRARAAAALGAAGYRPEPPLSPETAAIVLRGECEQTFRRPRSLTLELHWSVIPPSYGTPVPAERLLRRSQSVDVLGWVLPTLSVEDAVVAAAVHGHKHFWQGLEHAAALAGLLASPQLDAAALLPRARELGALRRTLVAAGVVAGVMETPLPAPLAAALGADAEAQRVTAIAAQELRGTLEGRIAMRRIGRSTRLDVRALDRPADLARCLATKIGLPRLEDREWLPLPDSAAAAYYGVRPFRLALSAVVALARRLRTRRSRVVA